MHEPSAKYFSAMSKLMFFFLLLFINLFLREFNYMDYLASIFHAHFWELRKINLKMKLILRCCL